MKNSEKKLVKIFVLPVVAYLVFSLTVATVHAEPAEVWVDDDYCEGCTNDGHIWGIDSFSKIQDGMNAVPPPGTVYVSPGTYNEEITVKDGVNLVGAGPQETIIDAFNKGSGVKFSFLNQNTLLEGFTIRSGKVNVYYSSPTVRGNVIKNCSGAGIEIMGDAAPLIENNVIVENTEGIYLNLGAQPTIRGNIISGNNGPGLKAYNTGRFSLFNNVFAHNKGDGIAAGIPGGDANREVNIINNTIVGNKGAGININRDLYLQVVNNIIFDNGQCGLSFGILYDWGQPKSDHNNIWGNVGGNYCGTALPGTNDISANPILLDILAGDFHLLPFSPCVDAGTSQGAPTTDFEGDLRPLDGNADGQIHADMGADEARSPLSHDVALQVSAPKISEWKLGESVDVQLTLWNVGKSREAGAALRCEIRGASGLVYEEERLTGTLDSRHSDVTMFSKWKPQAAGQYQLACSAELSGDEDTVNNSQRRVLGVKELKAEFKSEFVGPGASYVQFTDLSEGAIDKWLWDFGDGFTSDFQNPPVHIYQTPGVYTVSLTVWSKELSDTETKFNHISLFLDPFCMEVRNEWTYEGVDEGVPVRIVRNVTTLGTTMFPKPAYEVDNSVNGVWEGRDYCERTNEELLQWGQTARVNGYAYTLKFAQPLPMAWLPMAVSDHRALSTTAEFIEYPGAGFNVTFTAEVLSQEPVTLRFDTLDTFKVRYVLRIWGQGIDETETFTSWMAPYIGIVKEVGENYSLEMTSFGIGGTITDMSDKDGDGLKDYREFFTYHTNWQSADTDNDGCGDSVEVQVGRDPLAPDPQGDLNRDCIVDISDAVMGLQSLLGLPAAGPVAKEGDVNADGKIGMAEVLYILQKAATLR